MFVRIFVLFSMLFLYIRPTSAQVISPESIYTYARDYGISYIRKIQNYVDVQDTNGTTALCVALKNNDSKAYSVLRQAGADTHAECTKYYKPIAVESKGSFMGVSSAGWKIGAAIIAGGAAVAAAAGGGGGGGSEEAVSNCDGYSISCYAGFHPDLNDTCQNGQTKMYKCVKNICPADYKTSCDNGYTQSGKICQSGNEKLYECVPNQCAGFDYDECPAGYDVVSSCLSGTQMKYKCRKGTCYDYPFYSCPENALECESCSLLTSTKYLVKSCKEGWTGSACTVPAACTGYIDACPEGAVSCTECKSGTAIKYRAESCKEGWEGDNCLTPAACTGYIDACPEGAVSCSECKSGNATKYRAESCKEGWEGDNCLTPATCTGYIDACPENAATCSECKSGNTTKYKAATCRHGWSGNNCTTAESCSGYSLDSCPENAVYCNTCQSGNNFKYQVVACKAGYTGDTCSQINCVHGSFDVNGCVCENGWTGIHCDVEKNEEDIIGNNVSWNTPVNLTVDKNVNVYGYKDVTYNTNNQSNTIKVTNSGAGKVYGMYTNEGTALVNTSAVSLEEQITGNIVINQSGTNDVYGMYYGDSQNEQTWTINVGNTGPSTQKEDYKDKATGNILINNSNTSSENNVYGMYTEIPNSTITNIQGGWSSESWGNIKLYNSGRGNTFGIANDATSGGLLSITKHWLLDEGGKYAKMTSDIKLFNLGNGNAYGLYAPNLGATNVRIDDDTNLIYGGSSIKVINVGSGLAVGIYAKNGYNQSVIDLRNYADGTAIGILSPKGSATSTYSINISRYQYEDTKLIDDDTEGGKTYSATSDTRGTAIGMYAQSTLQSRNGITPEMIIDSAQTGIGMYARKNINNNGAVRILNSTNAYGLYLANHNTTASSADGVVNDYIISISDATNAFGIYIEGNNSIVAGNTSNNYIIMINNSTNAYGIYIEDRDADKAITVENSGNITITNSTNAYGIYSEGPNVTIVNTGTISLNGTSCTGANCQNMENAIVLNGGRLIQNGAMMANSLNFNSLGGAVIASPSSKFHASQNISGNLTMGSSAVENGFDTTYMIEDIIDSPDTNELNLISQSALFDATLENNSDVVMTMKPFDSVVDDKSVAAFLQNNYAQKNNEKLFVTLKSAESIEQLNSGINTLFGKDMLSRMAFEDLSMIREVNFDMNNKLFVKDGAFAFGGNVSPANYDKNVGSTGRYSLNGYNDGKKSFGIGVSITDVHTSDKYDKNYRFDRNIMMAVPFGYKTHNFEFITSLKAGYADGYYNRQGFDNVTYKGKTKKRTFASMNEARYPFEMYFAKLIPSIEFNMIGYNISGTEDEKEYSLKIISQNRYSVESGVGLLLTKEFNPSKRHSFNLYGGAAVYHEFADPYKLNVGMNGMDGKYTIHDNRNYNRAVLRCGFNYQIKEKLDFTAGIITNINRKNSSDFNVNLKRYF